jgi:cold shock protein
MTGVVKFFDEKKGWGILENEKGESVFVHYTNIVNNGFKTLETGQRVSFETKRGPKGLYAVNLMRS